MMTQGKELTHQEKINLINKWVQEFHDGDPSAGDNLIMQFEPFLNSTVNRYSKHYQGVFTWDIALQEARIIFFDLLTEYTIGGTAYFNVYIQRKLPLRLRYCFIKEIRRRTRDLSHSNDQFIENGLDKEYNIDKSDVYNAIIDEADNKELVTKIINAIESCDLTDREKDMFLSNISGEQHTSIAKRYNISRSRASRIIKKTIEKIQDTVTINGNITKGDD